MPIFKKGDTIFAVEIPGAFSENLESEFALLNATKKESRLSIDLPQDTEYEFVDLKPYTPTDQKPSVKVEKPPFKPRPLFPTPTAATEKTPQFNAIGLSAAQFTKNLETIARRIHDAFERLASPHTAHAGRTQAATVQIKTTCFHEHQALLAAAQRDCSRPPAPTA